MKRLIVCCDGTWQSQDNKVATNVLKIAQAIKTHDDKQNISQILYYDQGIGAVPDYKDNSKKLLDRLKNAGITLAKGILYRQEKLLGGIFGLGISEKIEEAYIFLCLNYEPKDEIYLFGFSRGAYTVRSLAGLIHRCGLLQRPDINHTGEAYKIYRFGTKEEALCFRKNHKIEESVPIKFLGCWDTVGALGIPNAIPWLSIDKLFTNNLKFHDNKLSQFIEKARHAIAIDEKRSAFEVTLMELEEDYPEKEKEKALKQICFPGNHGCVGGGTDEIIELPGGCKLKTLDLSKAALEWMAKEAQQLGLNLDLTLANDLEELDDNCNSSLSLDENSERFIDKIKKFLKNIINKLNIFHQLRNLSEFKNINKFHPSVIDLWCDCNYRPKNLELISENLNNHCQYNNDVVH